MIESRLLAAGDELPALLTRQISGRLLGRDIPVRESVRQLGDITPQDISSLASELRLVTTYVLDQEVP
jgi:hypothetical protein